MGMSASQARLLSITSRMSDLEFNTQSISNSKMRLAAQSEDISRTYSNSLNQKKMEIQTGYNNGTPEYSDMSYSLLAGPDSPLDSQYGLSDTRGRLLVTRDMASKFTQSPTLDSFLVINGAATVSGGTIAEYDAANASVFSAQETYDGDVAAVKKAKDALDTVGNSYVSAYEQDIVTSHTTAGADVTISNAYNLPDEDFQALKSLWNNKTTTIGGTDYDKYSSDFMNMSNCWSGINNTGHGYNYWSQVVTNGNATSSSAYYNSNYDPNTDLSALLAKIYSDVSTNVADSGSNVSQTELKNQTDMQTSLQTIMDAIAAYSSGTTVNSSGGSVYNNDNGDNDAAISSAEANNLLNGVACSVGILHYGLIQIDNLDSTTCIRAVVEKLLADTTVTGPDVTTYTSTPFDYTNVKYNSTTTEAQKQEYTDAYNAWVAAKKTMDTDLGTLTSAKQKLAGFTYTTSDNVDYYTNLYNRMQQGYVAMSDENSTINNSSWLTNQIQNGNLVLEKVQNKEWKQTSWSTDSNIVQEYDDTQTAQVKAKYDSDMSEINNKDKKFDLQLKAIDTEHSALQTEYDSVKKVIDKNIEVSYKIFNS